MVFSSYEFILFFLPVVVVLCGLPRHLLGSEAKLGLLTIASLVYYAYWDWHFVWVIALSIAVNYTVGLALDRRERRKGVLVAGIVFNLGLLGYFKYTNFMLANFSALFGVSVDSLSIVLPLGISFFTFQQIAYLVDVYRNETTEHNFFHYILFVSFFPQLIAGPIVHHKEMMPQFVRGRAGWITAPLFTQGLAIFVLGVAKKVLIADHMGSYATPVFDAAAAGTPMPLLESWAGVLAYSLQIYFDFSAYSDMAIGLGLMFGIRLPVNFFSPYKSSSLIEFWRRWHMTLSRFLRDYLYFPLGGNRKGPARRHVNLMIVMLLGGLWHGAAWTFVVWGGLHGLGLIVNHAWRAWRRRHGTRVPTWYGRAAGTVVTCLFVALAWVFFRAADFATAVNLLNGMAGLNGVVLPATYAALLGDAAGILADWGVRFEIGYLFLGIKQVGWIAGLLAIVWFCPNTLQWARYRAPDGPMAPSWPELPGLRLLTWRPNPAWALGLSALSILCLVYMSRTQEFLYFQF